MKAEILYGKFQSSNKIKLIHDPKKAIKFGLELLEPNDGMAIIGTHCMGPAVCEIFKLNFDKL